MTSAASGPFSYPRLFSSLRLGPVEAPNRIVFGANFTMFTDPAATFGEPGLYGARYGDYLEERARGGAGVVIAGQAHVHPTSAYQMPNNAAVWNADAIPGLTGIARRISAQGALAFIQLAHNGGATGPGTSGLVPWSPSGVSNGPNPSKALEEEEIRELIDSFARSAAHAAEAGFEGIELHGAHGYLIHEFLSPLFNRRTDRYGGSLENRMRFLVEVLREVRMTVGDGMAVGVRLVGGDERPEPESLTAGDGAEIARRLEADGLIDFVNVSPGVSGSGLVRSLYEPHGCVVDTAATVKAAVVSTPVFAVHRIVTPAEAEAVLGRGDADAVTLVRALIADPAWPRKAAEGRDDEIRRCTGCNQGCFGNLFRALPITCVTNPAVGREARLSEKTLRPAGRSRHVVVVGGGPGGLEAAWVAAARGHEVTLFERSTEPGGQVRLAQRLPGREELRHFVDWRIDECERRGVELRTGRDVTAQTLLSLAPDAVILATGGRAGVDTPAKYHPLPLATDGSVELLDHVSALIEPDAVGRRAVVLDAVGFIEGIGLGELLAEAGREVVLVCPLPTAIMLDSETHAGALGRAVAAGVEWMPSTSVTGIEGGTVYLRDRTRGVVQIDAVDSLVVRTHSVPEDGLYTELQGVPFEVRRIGDAVAVRSVQEAVYDGHLVGRAV